MEYKVIVSSSPQGLTEKVNEHVVDGYTPTGGVIVNIIQSQNRFRGSQHVDTINKLEYVQSIVKNE